MHGDQKGEWGSAAATAVVAGSRWGAGAQWTPGPHGAAAPEWAHHRHDPTGTAHWNNVMQQHPSAMIPTGVPGASWGQPQPPLATPSDQVSRQFLVHNVAYVHVFHGVCSKAFFPISTEFCRSLSV